MGVGDLCRSLVDGGFAHGGDLAVPAWVCGVHFWDIVQVCASRQKSKAAVHHLIHDGRNAASKSGAVLKLKRIL